MNFDEYTRISFDGLDVALVGFCRGGRRRVPLHISLGCLDGHRTENKRIFFLHFSQMFENIMICVISGFVPDKLRKWSAG